MSLGKGLESLIPSKKNAAVSSDAQARPEARDPSSQQSSARPARSSRPHERASGEHIFYIEVDKIKPNPHQPRRDFNEEELASLAASISEHGILQPLVVTKHEIDVTRGRRVEYHLVAGERRWRAAQRAGFSQVPVIVREATEQTKLELALIENIQRQNLNPIEEARAFQKLSEEFSLTQEQIAERVGKSREAVANKIRLLALPHEVHTAIQSGGVTEGHAKVLLSLKNPEKQAFLASQTQKNSWSVRALEEHVRDETTPTRAAGGSRRRQRVGSDPELEALTQTITERLGANVSIQGSVERGKLAITFSSKEELQRIIEQFFTSKEKSEKGSILE